MNTVVARVSDRDLVGLLRIALDRDEWRIETIPTAVDAARFVYLARPHVICVDADREDAARFLQTVADVPAMVIGMTRDTSDEKALGLLTLGADTVYTKPIAPDFLGVRLSAIIRCMRKWSEATSDTYVYGNLTIALSEPRVEIEGEPIRLTATEYRLLTELASNAGRIVTHDQLLHSVWGEKYNGSYELLRTFIGSLRRHLREAGAPYEVVRTERQLGYWLPRPSVRAESGPRTASGGGEDAERVRSEARVLRRRLGIEAQKLLGSTQLLRLTAQQMQGQMEPTRI